MRTREALHRTLQIEIERCSYRAAQFRASRHDCIDKVRCAPRRIDMQDARRPCEEQLLIARDHTGLNESHERASVFARRVIRMSPRIQSRRRLWQTSQKNRLAQCEVARRFVEVCARGRLRADPAIAVTAAIQILGENSLLTPTALQLPGRDCFIKFAMPTALPAAAAC